MDDKDVWADEDTVLDEYQRQKELEEASVNKFLTREDFADMIAQQPGPSFGVSGPLQRVSSANDYIAKALERNPHGWMITSINQTANNPISYHGYQIAPPLGPEAEVNIRVSDPQLIATLHHAMQGYCNNF